MKSGTIQAQKAPQKCRETPWFKSLQSNRLPGSGCHPWRYLRDVCMWHIGTWFSVSLVVLGVGWTLWILQVFPNINDSMIL